jgi:predicted HicB family RNase H-like nuclease
MSDKQENKVEPVPLMLRLPPELHAKVKRLADKDRRSLNTMVIILIEAGLAQLDQPPQG